MSNKTNEQKGKQMTKQMTNEKRELQNSCDFVDGMKVEAEFCLSGTRKVVTGELKQNGSTWYLCQNEYNGSSCGDKRGYEYSWSIGSSWHQGGDDVVHIWATNKNTKPMITETANAVWKELEETINSVKSYAMGLETVDKVKDFTKALNKLCK